MIHHQSYLMCYRGDATAEAKGVLGLLERIFLGQLGSLGQIEYRARLISETRGYDKKEIARCL